MTEATWQQGTNLAPLGWIPVIPKHAVELQTLFPKHTPFPAPLHHPLDKSILFFRAELVEGANQGNGTGEQRPGETALFGLRVGEWEEGLRQHTE